MPCKACKAEVEESFHGVTPVGTVLGSGRGRRAADQAAGSVLAACAMVSFLAVAAIVLYMVQKGAPAILEVGWKEILFGRVWDPVGTPPGFGILYIVLTSLVGTFLAVLLGSSVGVLTAVFLAELAREPWAGIVRTAVELLAGIPSVVYGLLGIYLLNPWMYRLERKIFAGSDRHQFTGGANLLCAVLVLAVMILPTVISVTETAIRSVGQELRTASLALGASRMQTIFRQILPAARPGVATGVVLGVGRALGESMAVMLVAGNCVNVPLPFCSVRFLTTAIVSEMGYAQGTHRGVLFAIGLVLFGFITLVNGVVLRILDRKSVV